MAAQKRFPRVHLLNLPDIVVKPREHDLLSPIRIESEGRGGMFVVEYAGLFLDLTDISSTYP
jgi:hypothetical protein